MSTITLLVIGIVALAIGLVLFRVVPVVRTFFTYRGKRIITCPETLRKEAVDVAASRAAASAFIGDPVLRLNQCSRWPERQNCGQECLQQVEVDPDNCLVWNIVSDWYHGQSCVYCHRIFGALHHLDHPPAMMAPDGTTTEWNQIRSQQLFEVFTTHKPVCWNCHIAETFRHEHPELVIDRGR